MRVHLAECSQQPSAKTLRSFCVCLVVGYVCVLGLCAWLWAMFVGYVCVLGCGLCLWAWLWAMFEYFQLGCAIRAMLIGDAWGMVATVCC